MADSFIQKPKPGRLSDVGFVPITATQLIAELSKLPGSHKVFFSTATGSSKRPAIGVSAEGGKVVVSCAPPISTSWAGSVNWSLSNPAIATKLGISRQAVFSMRRRLFKKGRK